MTNVRTMLASKTTIGCGVMLLLFSSCSAPRVRAVKLDARLADASRSEGDPLAVGRLFRNDDYKCTAFHVGNGVVLTAGHCVPYECHVDGAQPATSLSIKWSAPEGVPARVSAVTRVLSCVRSYSLDYAVLRVSDPPREWLSLEANWKIPQAKGVPLFMITYPDKDTLSIVDGCSSQNFSGSHLISDYNFIHSCSVSPHSSGSPILLEGSRLVVGIHQGGIGDEVGSRVRQSALAGVTLP